MRKRTIIFATPLIFVALISIFLFWFKVNLQPISKNETEVFFVVPKGASASIISAQLYKNGLIKNKLAFKFYVQITGRSKNINAGEFKLSPGLSVQEIIAKLEGPPYEIWVTIPEGLRREEIPSKLIAALDIKDVEEFKKNFVDQTKELEGFLYPDTYLFPRDVKIETIIQKMKSNFDEKIAQLKLDESQYPLNLSFSEIVTVASLLERETKSSGEKPIVAGIIYNRLNANWPLQIDAAVQYGVASSKLSLAAKKNAQISNIKYWESLIKEDLDLNSPYNTYKFAGLPPTPIANAGFYSLKAAFYPEDSPYWFYIHDDGGEIHYAKTLEEHNKNIKKYLGK
jgi:UPF0755 protein